MPKQPSCAPSSAGQDTLLQTAAHCNEAFQRHGLPEPMRCVLVSAFLLALRDEPFCAAYPQAKSADALVRECLLPALARCLARCDKKTAGEMLHVYGKLLDEPLVQDDAARQGQPSALPLLLEILQTLAHRILPLASDHGDVLGQFFTEFVRFSTSRQKQGVVLTPPHAADLFCDLVPIQETDVVYDPCCGTGSLLLAATLHGAAPKVCGTELRPELFCISCAGLLLRGETPQILRGDCFSQAAKAHARQAAPTVALLNPPYDRGPVSQLQFVEAALEAVAPQQGTVVAIVQTSCCLGRGKEIRAAKQRLLEKSTLRAVISMPDELFYPVLVSSCILVLDAATPNRNTATWFGYLKDDGFFKRKSLGRADYAHRWEDIRAALLAAYRARATLAGKSTTRAVTAEDVWCAEAYLQTDYTVLRDADFIHSVRQYVAYHVSIGDFSALELLQTQADAPLALQTQDWQPFVYADIFTLTSGTGGYLQDMAPGPHPYVSATGHNNGVSAYVDSCNSEKNRITVNFDGSIGDAFFHDRAFFASEKVAVLARRDGQPLDAYTALFLVTLIQLEKYRYSYGLKWSVNSRMRQSVLYLPAVEKEGARPVPDWDFMRAYMRSLCYSA